MKKNTKLGYVILVITFVLFNVIALAVPMAKTPTFWASYVFTAIAFLAQIVVWKIAFGKEDTMKSKFLGFPIIHIGTIYLVVQTLAFVVFMIFPLTPVWVALIACAVFLTFFSVCIISTDMGTEEVIRVEEKVTQKTAFISGLKAAIDVLYETEKNTDLKAAYKELSEKIRFSDPMSSDALAGIEQRILMHISELKNSDNPIELIHKTEELVAERNIRCKTLK